MSQTLEKIHVFIILSYFVKLIAPPLRNNYQTDLNRQLSKRHKQHDYNKCKPMILKYSYTLDYARTNLKSYKLFKCGGKCKYIDKMNILN